jgi:hypothetical protein
VSHFSFACDFFKPSRGLGFISNANPACSCVYICKFQFRPIHPPLGDYQSPKTVTTSLMVGRSKPGCDLCPALSFKDLHHPCWGGGRAEPGPAFAWDGVLLLPPASGAGNHPLALRKRHPPAMPGKANCCCPTRVQHSVLCLGDGGQSHRGVSLHVVRREGGTRVLGWSHSRFRGKDGSEDLPARFGATGAR